MKKFTIFLSLLILSGFINTSLIAAEYKAGDLVITHLWVKAPPKGAKVAGGYLKITNKGEKSDRLTGGSFIGARKVEVHEMSIKDGIMSMKSLENGLEIKAGQTVFLKPGSFHLMLMGLSEQLKDGDTIKGSLVFEKAGTIDVEFKIKKSVKAHTNTAPQKTVPRGSHN